jgi:hypothetical protein
MSPSFSSLFDPTDIYDQLRFPARQSSQNVRACVCAINEISLATLIFSFLKSIWFLWRVQKGTTSHNQVLLKLICIFLKHLATFSRIIRVRADTQTFVSFGTLHTKFQFPKRWCSWPVLLTLTARLVQLYERLHEQLHNFNSQLTSSLHSSLASFSENSLSQS